MSFFDSEIVRSEITEITILQGDVQRDIFKFPYMSYDEKKYYIQILEKFLNKIKVLYTRLSLSDDEDAIKMKEEMIKVASIFNTSDEIGIKNVFANVENTISMLKETLTDPLI